MHLLTLHGFVFIDYVDYCYTGIACAAYRLTAHSMIMYMKEAIWFFLTCNLIMQCFAQDTT
jgi:hypothetical protein